MWPREWRKTTWETLNHQQWDILIIGGGITGAGILREATRLGLRALLVEQRDFAWGTSSRSSKLVHGGLRYLKEGQLGLTFASVQEREQLLAEGPGLIDPLGFLLATYEGDTSRLVYRAGLTVYDLLALQWSHKYYAPEDFQLLAPHLSPSGLKGGFRYGDAQTDDARLVLRVIQEAMADGGVAMNYTRVESLLRGEDGRVCGAVVRDVETGQTTNVQARVVINATGAWADRLRQELGHEAKIRPLRGSHLVFPGWRLPVAQAISFMHPLDHRPVFILPWEGVTLVGTTDVDHKRPLDEEPAITPEEVAYLMAAVTVQFPSLELTLNDIIATYAGVRPVIGSGKADPSEESRDHVVWEEDGLLTVTGGKLTTFRLIALDALKAVHSHLPEMPAPNKDMPVLNPVNVILSGAETVPEATRQRLLGRYGAEAVALVAAAAPGELMPVPGTRVLWAELRWAARAEAVVHLDDLLLRRVRLGLLQPEGGKALLPRIREICQPELGWDDGRWEEEVRRYLALWQRSYSLPPKELIPDWREMVQAKRVQRESAVLRSYPSRRSQRLVAAGILGGTAVILAWLYWNGRYRKSPANTMKQT
ncbi:MAG: glycerol-3-phosphate dehydrogenase/oxidase [Chloroflexi bacterium]|nr:MAG: glycerol-3-phosphate dehydrogenase/oxidase [Chloroflexota bacterium]